MKTHLRDATPIVAVADLNDGVNITNDLTKLRSKVSRQAHSLLTLLAAIRSVNLKACYFTSVDAFCGYWQINSAGKNQHLTTFITLFGRFRYCWVPMSFSATENAFCLRGNMALQEIPNCVKIVDDTLFHYED